MTSFSPGIKRCRRKVRFAPAWKGRLKSIFPCDKKKPPRSGGPKSQPSVSGCDLERRSSGVSALTFKKSRSKRYIACSDVAQRVGFEPTWDCSQTDFESFPPCDFWWKLSEDGSTQRKPKSCGILRILASVFRFYLNPPGFPSSSHFCPEL